MNKKNDPYKFDNITLNSTKPIFLCSRIHPCKRVTTCNDCFNWRRDFFINAGLVFCKQWGLDSQLVVSWSPKLGARNWEVLTSCMSQLSKLMSARKVGKYIRVLNVGPNGNPHVHMLVSSNTAQKIAIIAKKKWPNNDIKPFIHDLTNTEGVLGYFFDKNYYLSIQDETKIKGTRPLSASRPFPCGFPAIKQAEHFEFVEANFMEKMPLPEDEFKQLINWNGKESYSPSGIIN